MRRSRGRRGDEEEQGRRGVRRRGMRRSRGRRSRGRRGMRRSRGGGGIRVVEVLMVLGQQRRRCCGSKTNKISR